MAKRSPRRIPRGVLIVPSVAIGLFLVLAGVAWRSNQFDRQATPIEQGSADTEAAVFLTCAGCHEDIDRVFKVRDAPNLKFTHKMHFTKGVSDCSVCHFNETHSPDVTRVPTMSRCFTCHGLSRSAIVTSTCTTCHTRGIDPQPRDHSLADWVPSRHGELAREDRFECLTCHQQSSCMACHGVALPHEPDWKEAPHALAVFREPQVCDRCHPRSLEQTQRDDCDSCHHPQGPDEAAWLDFHPRIVRDDGAMTCFECHAAATCATCHLDGQFSLEPDEMEFERKPYGSPVGEAG